MTQRVGKSTDDQRLQSNLAEVLASALEERAMLSAVARLLVPRIADICLADIIDDDGTIQRVDHVLDDWQLAPIPALRSGEPVLLADVTQGALAKAMGVQRKHVNELCNGRRNVTAATALILARVFGNSPDFWLNVQRRSDLWGSDALAPRN